MMQNRSELVEKIAVAPVAELTEMDLERVAAGKGDNDNSNTDIDNGRGRDRGHNRGRGRR